jgi:starch phosphorylase
MKVHLFEVKPKIPKRLEGLFDLAYNLHWCWDHRCVDLFQRLDPDLWEEVYHNPIKLLGRIRQDKLLEALEDDGFLDHLQQSLDNLNAYMMEHSWFQKEYQQRQRFLVAYFSAEFGLHECLPIYSGGLGILAGDHLRSVSDLGIPMVGVG